MAIKNYTDLDVYRLSYDIAMDVFDLTKEFPIEEKYSLKSQIINSSRSVPANIAEGWAKRKYENIFKRQLLDSIGSLEETKVWLHFALDCKYITKNRYDEMCDKYDEIGKKLFRLHSNWTTV